MTCTKGSQHRNYRWHQKLFLLIATPLALLVSTTGPGLAHDDDERIGGAHSRENSRTPRGEGHRAQHHDIRLLGFHNLQARSAYQPIIHQQGSRWIAYIGHHGGSALNTLTGVVEPNGTSIVDVTNPRRPVYLKHLPGASGVGEAGGAQMVRACNGSDLPKGNKDKVYLLRATSSSHEIYDVTNPSNPSLVKVIIGPLADTHKNWWECDTGIAYLVADGRPEGMGGQRPPGRRPAQGRSPGPARGGPPRRHSRRRWYAGGGCGLSRRSAPGARYRASRRGRRCTAGHRG